MAKPTKRKTKGKLIWRGRNGWPKTSKSTLSLTNVFSCNIHNLGVGETKTGVLSNIKNLQFSGLIQIKMLPL
jgi:hypothetical protein